MLHELPESETIGGELIASDNEPGAGTELWFARRIAREHGDSLKYVWAWRAWIAWQPDQGRWVRDAGAAAWSAAKTSVQRLLSEASSVAGEDEAHGKLLLKAARRFMGRSSLEAGLKLAQSEAAMIAEPGDWDAHPHLLNCSNGTVDLRDGTLRPHRREDRLTKTTGVKYQPGASAPTWTGFLERILPDIELRHYVQTAIGYSAIGSVTEHLLHVGWGGGANGKSVLFGTTEAALGEYSVSVPTSLLVSDGHREHPTLLTTLFGARFAFASETAEGGRFHEPQLKMLTGGDRITGRGMRENFWSFDPTHTLWLMTNHRPRVKETTFGFWRRMRLVPFAVTIPAAEQDKRLPDKLRDELPGVVAWIVAGAVRYFRDGLEPPAVVVAATAEYQAEEDELREFVDMHQPGGFTTCKALHEHYATWAETAGVKPVGQRTLTKALKDRGWGYTTNPRGFRVCRVPERDSGLISREDTRVSTYRENRVSNAARPKSVDSKPLPADPPNAEPRSSGLESADDDPDGDLVDRLMGDAP